MEEFVDALSIHDLVEGQGRALAIGGKMIAFFRFGNEVQAIDDFCPHMGASLAEGRVKSGCVSCPWHAWQFRLSDGAWLDNPKMKASVYNIRMQGDRVLVNLEPRAT